MSGWISHGPPRQLFLRQRHFIALILTRTTSVSGEYLHWIMT